MRVIRRRPRFGSRPLALLVFLCLLVQQTATPIHLLTEDHCRVVDTAASSVPDARCRHAVEHHVHHAHHDDPCAHHVHHAHDHGGHRHAHAAGSGDDHASDCPNGHCPHPVDEHLTDWVAVMQRERAGAALPLDVAALAPEAPAESAPDRIECVAPRPTRPPPRDLSFTPASPRAPPTV
jgi:hypothetical protein